METPLGRLPKSLQRDGKPYSHVETIATYVPSLAGLEISSDFGIGQIFIGLKEME